MFTKSERYFFNQQAIKVPALNGNGLKNRRTVWSINTEPCPEAHFAVFPRALVRPCIISGTRDNDLVLDPFYGAGTVGMVAQELGRRCVGIELKEEYVEIARKRNTRVQRKLIPSV
jgi:DNA modification methylase